MDNNPVNLFGNIRSAKAEDFKIRNDSIHLYIKRDNQILETFSLFFFYGEYNVIYNMAAGGIKKYQTLREARESLLLKIKERIDAETAAGFEIQVNEELLKTKRKQSIRYFHISFS